MTCEESINKWLTICDSLDCYGSIELYRRSPYWLSFLRIPRSLQGKGQTMEFPCNIQSPPPHLSLPQI